MFDREYWTVTRKVGVASVFGYSDYFSSYAATRAVDGDTGNYWRTNSPNGAYIIVELSAASAVSGLRWYVGNTSYYAKEFTVAGSNDGESFDDLFTGGCKATTGWQEFSWVNDKAYKYVRVTCNVSNNSSRLQTYELEFIGSDKRYFDKSYGKYIVAVFDDPISEPIQTDAGHFSVTAPFNVMGTDGRFSPEPVSRAVSSVVMHPSVENAILIALDSSERLDECLNPVVLAYDGAGSLVGAGGPVEAFEVSFDSNGLDYKGDQLFTEHIELLDMVAVGNLLEIKTHNTPLNEHIGVETIAPVGVLIHINDI